MSTYRVAVIGAGHRAGARDQRSPIKGRGVQSHADAYRHITECALVAAADPNTDNLGRLCGLYDIPRKYTDYRSMLAEVKPDILSICTTARPRAEIILAAAEGGVRAVYAEKALCGSMEEADRIVETCTRHGIVFNYGTNRRYDTNYGEVRRVVADGEIGEPTAAIFYGGGLLLHGGSHTFDTLMFLLGDPEVEAVQGRLCAYEEWGEKWLPEGRKFFNRPIYSAVENRFEPDPTLGVNDFTSDPGVDWAYVRFAGGIAGHFLRAPNRFDFAVYGSQGHVYCSEGSGIFALYRRKGRFSREYDVLPLDLPAYEDSTVRIIRDLIRALETGAPTKGSVEIAHRSTEICLAVAESHIRGGARILLPLQNRKLYVPNH